MAESSAIGARMSKRPDYVIDRPDGLTEQFFFKVQPSARPGATSWMRKIVSPDGETLEVWHEVADGSGRMVHAHQHLVVREQR
jgi:hypothetical protein